MKIKEIKRDKSNYKTIKDENDIDEIIEIPLRKPMKELYRKNIITIMSSANEINAKWLDEDGNNMYETKKDFDAIKFSYGNGFAYIILDYDSLSEENKIIMTRLYDELNEEEDMQRYERPITSEQSYKGNKRIIYAIHQKENPYHAWEIDDEMTYRLLTEEKNGTSDNDFFKKGNFVYTTPYTERSIIIRYPVNEETESEDVEEYFSNIFSKLQEQEKRITIDEVIQNESQFIDRDKSRLYEIARNLFSEQNKKLIYQPYTGYALITEKEKREIIDRYIKSKKEFMIEIVSTQINNSITEEQKYKAIFDYFVNKCKYDYSILDTQRAFEYFNIAFSSYRNILKEYIKNIDNYNNMSNFEKAQKIIEQIPRGESNKELLDLMKNAQRCYANAQNFMENSRNYRYGNVFATHYGVCENFSRAFKEVCDVFSLPCESVYGHILSDGIQVGHAWNAIVVNDEIRFVDISGAIHSKDGTYINTKPEDFFNVNSQQLENVDNGKNRTLTEESRLKIIELKRKMHPSGPNGGKNSVIQNSKVNTQNLEEDAISLD